VPGIAGIIAKSGAAASEQKHTEMLRAMKHEPFYTSGVYSEESLNLRVGWVIPKNFSYDSMPLVNAERNIVMVFHGEDFSRNSSHLRLMGNRPAGFESTSYLIRLYERMGDSFLRELNGWFAGVLIDLSRKMALLFNDRYGMQRLYYHESDEALFFSSEAKSLLRVIPSLREINPEALGEYLAFDCVLENKSLFKGISVLPGGSCWTLQGGRCRRGQYFKPQSLESTTSINENDVVDRLEQMFLNILPNYFRSSDKLAISLTGGLDTRLLMAALRGARGYPAYTFAGNRDTFDVRQARHVADASELRYQVVRLGDEFLETFPKLAEETIYISDGELGVSGTHNLYLNRLARQIAPVRLTGLFGSEVLRQGRILPRAPKLNGLLDPDLHKHIKDAERLVFSYRAGHPLTTALCVDIPWRAHGIMSIERSQVTVRSPFMDNDLVELLYAFPNTVRESRRVQQEIIRCLNPQLARILSNRGHASDRNPLVCTAAQMFLWFLFKLDYLYFFEAPDWMLKYLSRLPLWALGYHKFEHYRIWYWRNLADYLRDMLLDRRTLDRPFFDSCFLQTAVKEHIAGRRNYRNEISAALTLELIMRTLIENNVATDVAEAIRQFQPQCASQVGYSPAYS
jgi:asparagine synthase (glutamine-hydrolysing)